MAIKINDLPSDAKISRDEMKKVVGGINRQIRIGDIQQIGLKPIGGGQVSAGWGYGYHSSSIGNQGQTINPAQMSGKIGIK